MPDDIWMKPTPTRRPMAIKGLTPSLPERGRIKIGQKGEMITSRRGTQFQPPQKLDHFVITTLERGPDGNFLRDEALMQRLGPKPTELPVRLLYDDPVLNFPTRMACFVGRSLWCSGDGETATRMTDTPQQMSSPARAAREVECPCPRSDPAYAGTDKCKMNGALSVLIDGAGGIGGVWKFRTTSYNSIVGILSAMSFIRHITGGPLANIPLSLKLQPKQASAPDGTAVLIYIVSLEYSGDMDGLQSIAHRIALDRAKAHVSIEHIETEAKRQLALLPPSNVPLPGDDSDDIVDEFYPEQATPAPARPELHEYTRRPRRDAAPADSAVEPDRVRWTFFDEVGVEHEHPTADEAADAFAAVIETMRDIKSLDTLYENGAPFLAALREAGENPASDDLVRLFNERVQKLNAGTSQKGGAPVDPTSTARGEPDRASEAPAEPAEMTEDATSTAASPGLSSTGDPGGAPYDVLVPTSDVQAWYSPARAKLREMLAAGCPPADFARFREANSVMLGRLQADFGTWAKGINELISRGEQGQLGK